MWRRNVWLETYQRFWGAYHVHVHGRRIRCRNCKNGFFLILRQLEGRLSFSFLLSNIILTYSTIYPGSGVDHVTCQTLTFLGVAKVHFLYVVAQWARQTILCFTPAQVIAVRTE